MTISERIELYCTWAVAVADNNTHGYSQDNRWSPDYDCSSFVISSLEQAGFEMKKNGASYTGNMITALMRCGFELVQNKTLRRGDILLTHNDERQHTAIYLGGGKIAHARGANGHDETGDQTGLEICVSDYYPFDHVFRYPHTMKEHPTIVINVEEVKRGSMGRNVEIVQLLLNHYCGYFLDVDGVCGELTENAIKAYQQRNELHKNIALVADGICGIKTWSALINNYM